VLWLLRGASFEVGILSREICPGPLWKDNTPHTVTWKDKESVLAELSGVGLLLNCINRLSCS
jgi:hypothetical protein